MRINRFIVASIAALALIIGGLSVASARLGPNVDTFNIAGTFDGTSVNTQIAITFTAPMREKAVAQNFRIVPGVKGDFSWVGNEVVFSPRRSLKYATHYEVTIETGATDSTGKTLIHPFHRSFVTQSEHVMYLGAQGSEKSNLVLASTSGQRSIVGGASGQVTDYSLSFDRSLAVYVRRGKAGERPDEIWLLSLADNSTQRVYRRTDWSISQPHFSPDGRFVVFLATNVRLCRKYYGCFRDTSGPIVELLDLHSRRVHAFRSSSDVPITNFIDFSPSGQVAYTDLGSALTLAQPNGSGVLHIPNRGNSLEFAGFDLAGDKAVFVGQTPSSTGGDILVYWKGQYFDVSKGVYDSSVPSFATSGDAVAYASYQGELGIEPIYGVSTYNFADRTTKHLTSEHRRSDWSPSWSQDDEYLAFVRSSPREAMYMGSGEIWVIGRDGSHPHALGGVGQNPQWVQ